MHADKCVDKRAPGGVLFKVRVEPFVKMVVLCVVVVQHAVVVVQGKLIGATVVAEILERERQS